MLLRSNRMREVVAELAGNADFVFFDSPPLLAVTDPLIIASLVDGVLLVVESGRTRREPVRLAIQLIERANPKFISTVLNKVVPRGQHGYGGYYYDYAYEYGVNGSQGSPRGKRLISRVLQKLRIRKPGEDGTRDGAREKHSAAN